MFSSFVEERGEAEEYGRAWRRGISVMFELRSASCPRLWNRIYLLHPFAVLQVEAVTGNVVKLVEVELVERELRGQLPTQRPPVVAWDGRMKQLHMATMCGDIRAIARLATRSELVNGQALGGCAPLVTAAVFGKAAAVKALAWFGADVNMASEDGGTPVIIAAQRGNLEVVKTLASLGADLSVRASCGTTPVFVAPQWGRWEVVKTLASLGVVVNNREKRG
jgi:hypothetical protein